VPLREQILQRLAVLQPEAVELDDDSAAHAGHAGAAGGGGHFSLMLVSSAFAGRTRIERHRLVYAALGELIPSLIHALSLRAYAPDEL
jgi:BolA protein